MSGITTIADLLKYLSSGNRPVVEFQKGVEDKEAYAEPGMRARVLSVEKQQDGVVAIRFEFAEFDTFNLPFESSNYFDRQGKPTWTAREAGFYTPQDVLYYDINALMANELTIVDDIGSQFYGEYSQAGADAGSYIAWLEKRLAAALKG